MPYEWDEQKRLDTFRTRNLDFADVEHHFQWMLAIEEEDFGRHGEARWRAIGEMKGQIVVVVYTIRGESIRLISVFPADARDRRRYHNER